MIETRKSEGEKPSSTLSRQSKMQQKKWEKFLKDHKNIPALHPYNLTICEKPKFLWFRNAKVGTRTTMKIIDDLNLDLVAAQPFNTYYSPEYYKDYFKFAFVRNPYDRLVSGWYNKVVRKEAIKLKNVKREDLMDFNAFVDYLTTWDLKTCNIHFRLQSLMIDMNEVDYIGRMETFEEDLKQVFNILSLQVKKIPHSNKSKNRQDYKSYYNEETQQKVEQIYKKDLQLFGYSF